MKRLLWLAIFVFVLSFGGIISLNAQDSNCPVAATDPWGDIALRVLTRLGEILGTPLGELELDTAAELQALRRELVLADRPACVEAYEASTNALNLAADSIVAYQLRDDALAEELLAQSSAENTRALGLFVGGGGNGPVVDVEMTSPVDGEEVPRHTVPVKGNYDPASYGFEGPNHIWLFVIPTNQKLYPQIIDGCSDNPTTVGYRPNNGTWSSSIFLGTADSGRGEAFEIILARGNDETTAAMYATFAEWCAAGDYPGISFEEFDERGFVQIGESIIVDRAP